MNLQHDWKRIWAIGDGAEVIATQILWLLNAFGTVFHSFIVFLLHSSLIVLNFLLFSLISAQFWHFLLDLKLADPFEAIFLAIQAQESVLKQFLLHLKLVVSCQVFFSFFQAQRILILHFSALFTVGAPICSNFWLV